MSVFPGDVFRNDPREFAFRMMLFFFNGFLSANGIVDDSIGIEYNHAVQFQNVMTMFMAWGADINGPVSGIFDYNLLENAANKTLFYHGIFAQGFDFPDEVDVVTPTPPHVLAFLKNHGFNQQVRDHAPTSGFPDAGLTFDQFVFKNCYRLFAFLLFVGEYDVECPILNWDEQYKGREKMLWWFAGVRGYESIPFEINEPFYFFICFKVPTCNHFLNSTSVQNCH